MTETYYVEIVDAFSDTLVALGLQRILADLLDKQGSPMDTIQYQDCGSYVQLELTEPIAPSTIAQLSEAMFVMGGVRFIKTVKNAASLPDNLPDFWIEDYEERKAQNGIFYDAVRSGVWGDDLPPKPLSWDVLRAMNPAALPGWTSVLSNWWHLRGEQPLVVGLMLDMFRQLPNPIDEAATHWKQLNKQNRWDVSEQATCQQFFNPVQGKGQNRTKADAVSVGNMKGFWLIEFLKMIGFYNDVITRTVAGGKDRKVFVIAPRNMHFGLHNGVLSAFKQTITSEASIRFDILAALRYTRTLLDHIIEADDDLFTFMMGRNIQQDVVSGFQTAFYLDLGNAVATMNVSTIAVPGWIALRDVDGIEEYRSILDELIAFTRQFDEGNSDAFTLLQHLRDFVSGDDLTAFFRLTNAFPGYYMGMRERGKYAQQFITPTIERIITMVDPKLTPILESPGFQNIAYAIRHSTVIPQYRKAGGERLYDIRYGLGQDLTRVARKGKGAEFLASLADFIHLYNAENARIYEVRQVQYRRNITTEDINDIADLVDTYDAPTIARLLVAYGYARVPRDDEEIQLETDA